MELLPYDPDELWDWLLEQEQEQVVALELLAFCVGKRFMPFVWLTTLGMLKLPRFVGHGSSK